MSYRVALSHLANMNREDRERELSALTRSANAPINGRGAALDARIRQFELRYEMSSAAMRLKLKRRELRETAEIAEWLFLLDTRGHSVAR